MSSVTIDQLNPVSALQLNAKVEIQQDAVSYSATVQQILDLSPSGSGNVVGPSGGATDNALARYDGRTGLIIKNSLALLSDSGQLSNVKLAANVEVSNALIYASDVRQMFSPGDTNAGINVGSHATNPTAPINGDLIYNLTTRLFQFYQGNNWVALGSGTGSPLTTKGDIYVYSTVNARLAVSATAGQVLTVVPSADSGLGWTTPVGSGDVDGPSVSIENALVRFDGATGKIIKNSGTLLSDSGQLSNVKLTTDVEVSNSLVYGSDVRQTFNPGNTRAGLNVGSNSANPSAALNGDIIYNSASNLFQFYQNNVWAALGSGTGSGDVTGPGSATDDAIVTFDGTTGKLIQNSIGILDENGNLSGVTLMGVAVGQALVYDDGIKQIFNPTTTNAGINIGAEATDPTAGVDGDMYFDSASGKFRVYEGAWIDMIRGGGTVTQTPWQQNIDAASFQLGSLGYLTFADKTTASYPTMVPTIFYSTDGSPNEFIFSAQNTDTIFSYYFGGSRTITLRSDSVTMTGNLTIHTGSMVLDNDRRQIFNPGATAAGINVGANATDPTSPVNGDIYYQSGSVNKFRFYENGAWVELGGGGGTGDVTGPGTATDNSIARFDGTTGKLIQNSSLQLSDSGAFTQNMNFTRSGAKLFFTLQRDLNSIGSIAELSFSGMNANNASHQYAEVLGGISSPLVGNEDGILAFSVSVAGSMTQFVTMNGDTNDTTMAKYTIFSPGASQAGLNVGAAGADPSVPVNGDMLYNSALNKFRAYQNGAWVNMITSVTSLLTTKGDLISRSNVDVRLGVGTAGQVLTVDASTTTGLIWATPGTGSGDVVGPAASTDNAVVTFDGTTGKLIQNSIGILDENGNLSGVTLMGVAVGQALVYDDGIKQIFNPTTTNAGINIGAEATDPTAGVDGDMYFDSASGKFRVYEGAWIDMIRGGGTVTQTPWEQNIDAAEFQLGAVGYVTFADKSTTGYPTTVPTMFYSTSGTPDEVIFSVPDTDTIFSYYFSGSRRVMIQNNTVQINGHLRIIGGSIVLDDNRRQIFNPGNTVAGLNVGSNATTPSAPTNGDIVYVAGTVNKLRFRQDGSWLELGGASILTTKGDLLTYSNVDARLEIGSDDQILTADSSVTLGMAWKTPSSGGSPLTKKGDLYTYSDTDIRLPVGSDGQILSADSTTTIGIAWITPGSGGNVSGPTASTMNAIPTYGNLVGDTLLNSVVTIATNGSMNFPLVATVSAGLFNARQAIALSSVAGLSDVNGRMTRTATQWAVSTPEFVIRNTETSAGAHTLLGIVKIDATPANDDIVSGIRFQNDNNGLATYASIITAIENVNTLGLLNFNVRTSNSETLTTVLQVRSTGISLIGVIQFSDNIRQTFNPGSASSGLNVGGNAADPSTGVNGDIYYNSANDKFRAYQGGSWVDVIGGGTGTGDVDGPSSAATNQIAVFDGTSGKRIKTSFATISSTGGLNTGKIFFQLDRDTNNNGDSIGEIQFRGRSASAATTQYAEIIAGIGSSTTSAEAGTLSFSVVRASAITAFVTLDGVSGTVQMVQHTTFSPTIAKAGLNIGTLALDPTAATVGDIYYNRTTFRFRGYQNGMWLDLVGVRGPATATENALARFDGTTGQLLQDSTILQDANDDLDISGHNLKGATGILDTNGLSLLTFTPVANSVNYINIRPASGSNAPLLTTVGTANNIGLQIVPKGSGTVLIGTTGNFNYQRILEIRGGNTQARSPGLRFSVSITNSFVIPAATITATGTGSAPNIVGFLSVYLGAASSPIFVLGDAAITSNTLFKFQKSVLFAGVTAPTSTNGALYFSSSLNKFQFYQNSGFQSFVQGAGTVGDNKVPTFNGTTGDIIQQSGISIDDDHNLISVNSLRSGVNRTFLQLHDVNLATNYIEITNAVTSSAPFISVGGSDSNIHLRFQAKGNGQLVMNSIVNLQAFSVIRVGGLFYDEQILTPAATHAFSIGGVDKVNVTLTSAVTTVTFTNLVAGAQLRVVFIAGSDTRTVNFPTTGHSDFTTGSFVIASGGIAILSIDCPTTSASDLIFNIKVYD